MTGNRIDFVSLLAWRTWSAFMIESDFIGFHFFCVYGRRRGLLRGVFIWRNELGFRAAPSLAPAAERPCL